MKNSFVDSVATIAAAPECGTIYQAAELKGGRNDWHTPVLHRLCVDQTANGVASGADGTVSTT